jgi:2-polyprenyl-3-methyl-5-hydroxy-6-metoxy-1,4-benzoquinol methylase
VRIYKYSKFYSKVIGKTLLSRSYSYKKDVEKAGMENIDKFIENSENNKLECIICSAGLILYLEISKIPYYECIKCKHLQIGIWPSPDFIKLLYISNSENESAQNLVYLEKSALANNDRIDEIAFEKVDFVLEKTGLHNSKRNLWVDIGSGIGEILLALSKLNSKFNHLGFESSKAQHQLALNRGLNSVNEFFDPASKKYPELQLAKVVSMFNVLEHVDNPVIFIDNISRQISDDCYLVIEVPKHPSLTSIIQKAGLQYSYRHIYPPDHLNIFSVESLEFLLKKFGIEILHMWFFGSDAIEIFSFVDGHLNNSSEGNFVNNMISINKLQKSIDESQLSDVMLVVAQKIRT